MTNEKEIDLLSNLIGMVEDNHKSDYDKALKMGIEALKNQKTGHWIFDKERLGYWTSTCSECEHIFHGEKVLKYRPKYCANCGAKMEGE